MPKADFFFFFKPVPGGVQPLCPALACGEAGTPRLILSAQGQNLPPTPSSTAVTKFKNVLDFSPFLPALSLNLVLWNHFLRHTSPHFSFCFLGGPGQASGPGKGELPLNCEDQRRKITSPNVPSFTYFKLKIIVYSTNALESKQGRVSIPSGP